jgi:hypothetical protein
MGVDIIVDTDFQPPRATFSSGLPLQTRTSLNSGDYGNVFDVFLARHADQDGCLSIFVQIVIF